MLYFNKSKFRLHALRFIFVVCCLVVNNSYAMKLNILCWEGYAQQELVNEFEEIVAKKYGVKISLNVMNVSDPAEFYEMILSRKVDLISPAHNIPKSEQWSFIKKQLVLPVNLENIPNYRDIISPLKKPHYISVFDDVYGVPIVYGLYGLYYNVDKLPGPPQSWKVFWDEKYSGQYSISSDYIEANAYIAALSMGYTREKLSHFNLKQISMIRNRLSDLIGNANNFWRGVDKVENLKGMSIATGWGFSIPALQEAGENWKVAYPREGTTGWVDNWMIGYSLKNKTMLKRIAEEWINYTLSPKVQAFYVKTINQFPVNTKAARFLSKEQVKKFQLNNPSFIKNEIILWPTLISKDQKAIKAIWQIKGKNKFFKN